MRYHQCGPVRACYDVCHGECFAASGDAEECLELAAFGEASGQTVDCLGLVAPRLETAFDLELGHAKITSNETLFTCCAPLINSAQRKPDKPALSTPARILPVCRIKSGFET